MSAENLSGNLPNKVGGNYQRPLPRDFEDANAGDIPWKNELATYAWGQRYLLPACLSIVDFALAPPTEVAGDIYVGNGDTTTVHADWDNVTRFQWARFDGDSSTWNGVDPVTGVRAYVIDASTDWVFHNRWQNLK